MAESQDQEIATSAALPVPALAAAASTSSPNKRSRSVVLYVPLPIQKVWDIVSDFFGERHGWPTQVKITPLTQNGLTVGARKRVEDKADPQQVWMIERLVAVNAQEYWYTYTVDECMAPETSYDGLLQLFPEYCRVPGEQGKTRVVWSYALLPLEGEQFVPGARMEQVERTLVAYLMGLQHLAYGLGAAVEDSSSSDSETDDDEGIHREMYLNLRLEVVRAEEKDPRSEQTGKDAAVEEDDSIHQQAKDQVTQPEAKQGDTFEDDNLTAEVLRDDRIKKAERDTDLAGDLSNAAERQTGHGNRQEGDPITQENHEEEIADALGLQAHERTQETSMSGNNGCISCGEGSSNCDDST